MPDFPGSLIAFERRFPGEPACAAYLVSMRWPDGFRCPGCGHDRAWTLRTKAWTFECHRCRRQTSVRAGTIMHGSKLPLHVWFWAAYLMATHSNGISARQLQAQLGLGSYKSAWLLSAKLRHAMVDPGRNLLGGLVEIHETTIPHRTKEEPVAGGAGRSHRGKMLVIGAVEIAGKGPGRIRLAPIADYSAASIHAFMTANLAPGATAKSDGWARLPRCPRGHARAACRRQHGRSHRAPLGPSCVLEPQEVGTGSLSRSTAKASPVPPRRVRLSLQPPAHPPCRLSLPHRYRNQKKSNHLQDVDPTRDRGISHLSAFRCRTGPLSYP